MQSNYTLMIVWAGGNVSQTGFATRELASDALDAIAAAPNLMSTRDDGSPMATHIMSAVILVNVPETIELEKPKRGSK